MYEKIPSSDSTQTIDILANAEGAAERFVLLCKEHLQADSLIGWCKEAGFSDELLHILGSVIGPLTIRCQTVLSTSRELQFEDPTDRLIEEVRIVFLRHQKTMEYLNMVKEFPQQAFIAVHTYFAKSAMDDRPLEEILHFRSERRTLTHFIDANIDHAILEHAKRHLELSEIPCAIQPSKHDSRERISFQTPHPRNTIDAILSSYFGQRKEKICWYYLFNDQTELSGHPHDNVTAIYFA